MAKIFFNDKAVKTEEETTILNWFTQEDGATIFLRDTRKDTYIGRDFIYGDIDPYKMGNDYYVDILEQTALDGTIAGIYVSEGSNFEIVTLEGREPLFLVRQEATKMALGMRPAMNKGIVVDEVAMGLFYEGTTISYQRDGMNIKDTLTRSGWKRISGPKDIDLGIVTTEEAYKEKIKRDKKMISNEADRLASLKDALGRKDVNSHAIKAIIAAKEDKNSKNTHILLLDDIKELVEQKIL